MGEKLCVLGLGRLAPGDVFPQVGPLDEDGVEAEDVGVDAGEQAPITTALIPSPAVSFLMRSTPSGPQRNACVLTTWAFPSLAARASSLAMSIASPMPHPEQGRPRFFLLHQTTSWKWTGAL